MITKDIVKKGENAGYQQGHSNNAFNSLILRSVKTLDCSVISRKKSLTKKQVKKCMAEI